jgi:hypothetical protein
VTPHYKAAYDEAEALLRQLPWLRCRRRTGAPPQLISITRHFRHRGSTQTPYAAAAELLAVRFASARRQRMLQ